MDENRPQAPGIAFVAPVHPLVGGAAQFNTALLSAMRERGPVTALTWRRLYPPLLHRRDECDSESRPTRVESAQPVLDWLDPRTWARALGIIRDSSVRALVLPWVHPILSPQYAYLMARAPRDIKRVVIAHNVLPHDPLPMAKTITKAVLSQADVIVTHSAEMRAELRELGIRAELIEAFHPRFCAADLSTLPTGEQVARERSRQGDPDLSLLAFGAVRPYKGMDIAIRALAEVDRSIKIRLTVAGVFWDGGNELRQLVSSLRLEDRVELRDGFVSNEEAALLFSAADAAVLPYRSATQSGVVQLAFAYGTPVVATTVGGLPEAIADGVDGLLCPPEDPHTLATVISRLPRACRWLADGVKRTSSEHSFDRYAEILQAGVA